MKVKSIPSQWKDPSQAVAKMIRDRFKKVDEERSAWLDQQIAKEKQEQAAKTLLKQGMAGARAADKPKWKTKCRGCGNIIQGTDSTSRGCPYCRARKLAQSSGSSSGRNTKS
jgi:rubrerythrin